MMVRTAECSAMFHILRHGLFRATIVEDYRRQGPKNGGTVLASLRRRGGLRSTLEVRASGVDPLQESEHALPHRLRGGAVVLGQVGVGEEVARARVGVRLEGGPGYSDGLA